MMKTKRSGHHHKQNQQLSKKKQLGAAAAEIISDTICSEAEQSSKAECKGVCSIDWKPATVAR